MEQFVIAPRRQKEWGWLMVVAFFFEGVGGGLYLISALVIDNLEWGLLVGLAIVGIGANAALLLDLGKPLRAWRVISRPFSSWISRGSLILVIFVALGTLYALPFVDSLSDLPWREGTTAGGIVKGLAAAGAVAIMLYAGFVLSYSPAIAFWNNSLLPVVFGLYSAMGGAAVAYVMLPFLKEGSVNIKDLETLQISLLVAALLFLAVYLMTMFYSVVAAKESVRLLFKGNQGAIFLGGVLVVGLLLPLVVSSALFVAETGFDTAAPVLAVMGLLVLAGGYLFRHSLIRVGVYSPII